jgi:hypothetical protein
MDWSRSGRTGFGRAQLILLKASDERAAQFWKEYPILDYGKGWDD